MNLLLSILLFLGIIVSFYTVATLVVGAVNKESIGNQLFLWILGTATIWSMFYYLS